MEASLNFVWVDAPKAIRSELHLHLKYTAGGRIVYGGPCLLDGAAVALDSSLLITQAYDGSYLFAQADETSQRRTQQVRGQVSYQ